MIMKKSRHILGISIVLLVTSVLILSLSNNKDIQEDDPLITGDKFVEWGDTLKKYSYIPETTSNNIASYENIDFITVPQKEIDQTIEFYKLRGINDEAAAEKAENYCKIRNALYYEAIQQGFEVTDQEIYDYLEELKAVTETASNKEQYELIVEGFGDEEEYWEYEFTVYQKNLPIQKMVDHLKETFYSENGMQAKDDHVESEDGVILGQKFNDYYEEYKEGLLTKYQYKVQ